MKKNPRAYVKASFTNENQQSYCLLIIKRHGAADRTREHTSHITKDDDECTKGHHKHTTDTLFPRTPHPLQRVQSKKIKMMPSVTESEPDHLYDILKSIQRLTLSLQRTVCTLMKKKERKKKMDDTEKM